MPLLSFPFDLIFEKTDEYGCRFELADLPRDHVIRIYYGLRILFSADLQTILILSKVFAEIETYHLPFLVDFEKLSGDFFSPYEKCLEAKQTLIKTTVYEEISSANYTWKSFVEKTTKNFENFCESFLGLQSQSSEISSSTFYFRTGAPAYNELVYKYYDGFKL